MSKVIHLYMELPKRIKEIREGKGLTQKNVADKLGVEPSNYSRFEKRGDKLTIEQLKQIAGALGVSLKDIFFTKQDSPNTDLSKLELAFEIEKNAAFQYKTQKGYLIDNVLKLILSIDNLSYTIGEKLNASQNKYEVFVRCICEYNNEVFTLATWQKVINKETSYFISLGQDTNTGEVLFNDVTDKAGQKHASQIKDTAFSNIQQNPDLWVINFINLTAFFKKLLNT